MSIQIVQMSADSKAFVRGSWRGCLGACICYSHPASFEELYNNTLDSAFKKYGLGKEKDVYNSCDISELFGPRRDDFLGFLEYFVKTIGNDRNVILNVVYTTLTLALVPNGIPYYGRGRYATKYFPAPKFLSDLSQYYPYICAWIVYKRAGLSRTAIYLDSLQGEITEAWKELIANHTVWILPNGDLCNPFISSSDLLVRYIDEKLFEIRGGLHSDVLEKLFENLGIEARIHYVGHNELDQIRPVEMYPLPLHFCYKRPMIFVLKEQLMEKEVEYVRKRRKLIYSLEKYACKVGSGYKFIEYSKDYKLLKDGDHLIYLGPRGKEQAEYLINSLGWKLTMRSIAEL